jgi:hypothetical protein
MDTVKALRWRRRRYAVAAYRARLGRLSPFSRAVLTFPGGWCLERKEHWFWRVRLALWILLAAAGWLGLGWPGIVAGIASGLVVELVASYRWKRGTEIEPGPNGTAGVREPRHPSPAGDAEYSELPFN